MRGSYPDDLEARDCLTFSLRGVRPLVNNSRERPAAHRGLDHRQHWVAANPAEIVILRGEAAPECGLPVLSLELNGDVLLRDAGRHAATGSCAEDHLSR